MYIQVLFYVSNRSQGYGIGSVVEVCVYRRLRKIFVSLRCPPGPVFGARLLMAMPATLLVIPTNCHIGSHVEGCLKLRRRRPLP